MYAKRIWYEIKTTFGMTALLPVPALACFAVLEWLVAYNDPAQNILPFVLRDFCLILPVSAALSAAHLMTVEKDEDFAELRASYVEPVGLQAVRRTAIALSVAALNFALGWCAYSWICQTALPLSLVAPVFAPALFLLGVALLVNNLSASYWGAAGVVLALWFLEIFPPTRGKWLGGFALFHSVWGGSMDGRLNDLLLWGLGGSFLLINILLGRRFFIKRMAGV